MSLLSRLAYWRRVFASYVFSANSQLSFWHERPEANEKAAPGELGEYYMTFAAKADYAGPFDAAGIPQLDYHGRIGVQYNPIAIAQYGLGNYNRFRQTGDAERRKKCLAAADWLVANLVPNPRGVPVWNHHFDWEYRTRLVAPWYSGLAQGQGISLLVRAHRETGEARYLEAARRAFVACRTPVGEGGVLFVDADGLPWIEEYIVSPPTHILNGFIWALWGVYDLHLATREPDAATLHARGVETLEKNLPRYDAGFWSLYEQSGTRMRMLASAFYHALHIVQLRVMHRLTGTAVFLETAERWETYRRCRLNRLRARVHKAIFKLCYY